MLDDCLPVNAEMTERQYRPEKRQHAELAPWWTGDVWKLIPILKKWRPDLRLTLVDTQPTGNVCITNLDPSSTVLKDNFYKIVDEYKAVEMNDESLRKFYAEHEITASFALMNDFEASCFVGP